MARKQNLLMSEFFNVLSPLLNSRYMDKIDQDSSSGSSITFGECNVRRLLFADDLALLSLNKSDLQYALDRFSDTCWDAGMKISTLGGQNAWVSCEKSEIYPYLTR